MCTYITELIPVTGSGKGRAGWFDLTDASVYVDHPVAAQAEHTLNIDFRNPALGPQARVAVELTAESALALDRRDSGGAGSRTAEGCWPRSPTARLMDQHLRVANLDHPLDADLPGDLGRLADQRVSLVTSAGVPSIAVGSTANSGVLPVSSPR